jgi:hypothetical protein
MSENADSRKYIGINIMKLPQAKVNFREKILRREDLHN